MRAIAVTAVLVLGLAACAGAPDGTANPGAANPGAANPGAAGPDAGRASPLAVFGTPVLIALKAPFCAATILVATPLGVLSEFEDPAATYDYDPAAFRRDLDDGISRNCGPPYAVAP